MTAINITYCQTPLGELILGEWKGEICLCDWRYRKMRSAIDKRITSTLQAQYEVRETDPLLLLGEQLSRYFNGDRKQFDLPILFLGSDFQQCVWQALMQIEYGQTRSYSQLAASIEKPSAVRAVASANGANALSIIVPCHRIIGSNGDLVGYAGGLAAKQKLLNLEHSLFS